MKARYSWYIILFLSFSSITVLFNNCAPNKDEPAAVEASNSEASVEVVTDFSGKLTANFQYVTTDGKAWGYAYDTLNKTKALKVIFYAGGPVGTGKYVGELIAKEAGVGANAGHYFSYKIPAEFSNGKPQKMWAYGHEATAANLIKPSPITFASYTPKAEDFFNANIKPFIQSNCTQCHTWTYSAAFYGPLMNALPPPSGTGTATTNKLIRKMAGLEGHNGGVFCTGGVTAGICPQIQAWWNAEFQ